MDIAATETSIMLQVLHSLSQIFTQFWHNREQVWKQWETVPSENCLVYLQFTKLTCHLADSLIQSNLH